MYKFEDVIQFHKSYKNLIYLYFLSILCFHERKDVFADLQKVALLKMCCSFCAHFYLLITVLVLFFICIIFFGKDMKV